MEWLQNLTYLQIFWGCQTLLVGLLTTYFLIFGGFWDKTHGERDPNDRVGLLQFKKRTGVFMFISVVFIPWIYWNAVSFYCWGTPPSTYLQSMLNTVGTPAKESTGASCILLASTLFLLHIFRRVYECMRVSIFSRRRLLGPLSALLMYTYPVAAGLSLVAEAPESVPEGMCLQVISVKWYHLIAVALFLWASWVQLKCHQTLAKLRRNRAGHIVTTGYKIPKGGMFDHLSSPHYFAEVLIYLSIGVILGLTNSTWWWLVAFVAANQFFLAYCTHTWYTQKFEDYPKNRKMFIPILL